ncbi:MAG TPA: HAD family hydrolase [Oscillospiraceae bacterium]|nr:HAD family hydrolase [Oscillospiraceae bacterium]
MRKTRPALALLYDFDKTLCTKDMQEYSFIPDVNMTADEFWRESNTLAAGKKMDRVLAYMHVMLERAHAAKKSIQRERFVALGKDLEFYPGVEGWFERINQTGRDAGVRVEHYIISSGLHEIIEGSSIYKAFREVFACEFLYDENNIACWPKNVVNYTTKTQFLFRINKGVLDLSNDVDLNKYTPEDERPVPFRNMIYIGDGLTDVPCMKLVKVNGGCSVAVYQKGKKAKVEELLQDGRVNFITPADYSENSELDRIVRDTVRKMALADSLTRKSRAQIESVSRR